MCSYIDFQSDMVRPLFPNVFTTYPQPIPQWIPADLCVRRDRQDGTAQSRLHLEGSTAVGEHESQVARPGTLALNQLGWSTPQRWPGPVVKDSPFHRAFGIFKGQTLKKDIRISLASPTWLGWLYTSMFADDFFPHSAYWHLSDSIPMS